MIDEHDHAAVVNAWLERSTTGLSPALRLEIFEASLGALWNCTRMTLGDVTLVAILDRVLYNAAEKFPFLSGLEVEPNRGVQSHDLRERVTSIDASELKDGIRFVLVELLTVIGNLTAEILTPELHAELAKIVVETAGLREKGAPAKPTRPGDEHTQREGEKS